MADLSRKRRRGDDGAAGHEGGDESASAHASGGILKGLAGREIEEHGRGERVSEGEDSTKSRTVPSGTPSEGRAGELTSGRIKSNLSLDGKDTSSGDATASRAKQAYDGFQKGANQADANGGHGGLRTGPKRKVALLLAYNGEGYQGLQKNPDAITIEEVLANAIHSVGGISDDNHGTLQKVWWSRAGRTDKGVHAVGQIISLKMVLQQTADDASQDEDALARRMQSAINQALRGTAIQVLGIERTTNSFCAHVLCSARQYEYLLPVHCLRRQEHTTTDGGHMTTDGGDTEFSAEERSKTQADETTSSAEDLCEQGAVLSGGSLCRESTGTVTAALAAAAATATAATAAAATGTAPAAPAAAYASPLNDEELTRLNATLAQFVGTHSFHNFTDQKTTCDDKSATRYIISACAGQQQQVGGRWFVPLLYTGQSFMLHQIRKMSSMAVLEMRGGGADAIRLALASPRVATIPLAPACALTLHRCYYSAYEKKRAKERGSVHFEHAAEQQLAFLTAHIYPHIARRDAAGDFASFLSEVDAYEKRLTTE